MPEAHIYWPVLLMIFLLLGWTAFHFSRRTFRIVVLMTAVIIGLLVTWFALALPSSQRHFPGAFQLGGASLKPVMLTPPTPEGTYLLISSPAAWAALAVILAAALACLDTWCARREPPQVIVPEAPAAEPGNHGLGSRREITEKLKFRLAAADVHKPATIPGGSTLDNLATVVAGSDIQGSKTTAALIRAVNALSAKPSTYEVRLWAQDTGAGRRALRTGSRLRITVDLQDARTGAIIATRTLGPCSEAEAADKAAGFTARQVFRRDRSTPAWALGSLDGEDLSAYLLSQEMSPKSPKPRDLRRYREDQRDTLRRADNRNADAVLTRYELACLHELLGERPQALHLHLRNRIYHPWFLRGRYRLAMSLSMLAGDSGLADMEDEIAGQLCWAGTMLRQPELQRKPKVKQPMRCKRMPHLVRLQDRRLRFEHLKDLLLTFAEEELRAHRNRMRVVVLLVRAFLFRSRRRALLEQLRAKPSWRRHPRRRLSAPWVALTIAEQHKRLIRERLGRPRLKCVGAAWRCLFPMTACYPATGEREEAQNDVLRKLGLDRLLPKADQRLIRKLGLDRLTRRPKGHGWPYWTKVPWQAVYNAACLCALPDAGKPQEAPPRGDIALTLLRLAIADPDCELDYPYEWINADPGLQELRERHSPTQKWLKELQASSVSSPVP